MPRRTGVPRPCLPRIFGISSVPEAYQARRQGAECAEGTKGTKGAEGAKGTEGAQVTEVTKGYGTAPALLFSVRHPNKPLNLAQLCVMGGTDAAMLAPTVFHSVHRTP